MNCQSLHWQVECILRMLTCLAERRITRKTCASRVSICGSRFKENSETMKASQLCDSRRTVTRPSATVKQFYFDVSAKMAKFFFKLLNGHATVVGRSRDRRLTVKQFYFNVSAKMTKFWKKSLNGHATVFAGYATVGRLSNNFFFTFQPKWQNFEKIR